MNWKKIFLTFSSISIVPLIAGSVCLGLSSNMTKTVDWNGQKVVAGIGFSNYEEIKINGNRVPPSELFYYESDDGILTKENVRWYGDIHDYYEFWSTKKLNAIIEEQRKINEDNSNSLYKATMGNLALLVVGSVLLGISIITLMVCVPGFIIVKSDKEKKQD